jgi:hypothetical protein
MPPIFSAYHIGYYLMSPGNYYCPSSKAMAANPHQDMPRLDKSNSGSQATLFVRSQRAAAKTELGVRSLWSFRGSAGPGARYTRRQPLRPCNITAALIPDSRSSWIFSLFYARHARLPTRSHAPPFQPTSYACRRCTTTLPAASGRCWE